MRFHPWVFSGAIAHADGRANEGDVVRVVDRDGRFLAVGHYQNSSIAVRILSFADRPIDEAFYRERIRAAYAVRKALGLVGAPNSDTYRLVHGEGDNLSGLVVDIYGDTAVVQAHSVGMHNVREWLARLLVEEVEGLHNVYYKSEGTLPYKAPVVAEDGYLIGTANDCIATENGLKFQVDWLRGQKTGFLSISAKIGRCSSVMPLDAAC